MEENKMYVRKSFFMHQYEEEEQLLRDMRSKGWKFVFNVEAEFPSVLPHVFVKDCINVMPKLC
jgi:hypothetical protein